MLAHLIGRLRLVILALVAMAGATLGSGAGMTVLGRRNTRSKISTATTAATR